jgi:hypothetical protein
MGGTTENSLHTNWHRSGLTLLASGETIQPWGVTPSPIRSGLWMGRVCRLRLQLTTEADCPDGGSSAIGARLGGLVIAYLLQTSEFDVAMDKKNGMRFLNVDLDIRGSDDLTLLVKELEPYAFSLNPYELKVVSLEVNSARDLSLVEAIEKFHFAYTTLSDHARALWQAAESRSFNAGFELSAEMKHSHIYFPESVVRVAAEMNARLEVTLYKQVGS